MAKNGTGTTFLICLLAAFGLGAIGIESDPRPTGERPKVPPADPDVCATGCAAQRDHRSALTKSAFESLLERASEAPLDEHNAAYEELLFHREEARTWLEQLGPGPLESADARELERELERDEAWLALRLVTTTGEVRAELGPIVVPLGEKQHLFPEQALGFVPPEVSGTVRRVGARHLWTRL